MEIEELSPFEVASMLLLLDVRDTGSVTAAAERWSMTPSAASQRLGRLERTCGQPLVVRHARGVTLTEAGEAVCRHAENIRGELRAAHGSLASLLALETGRVRLGSFPTASATLTSDALRRFRRRHSGVEVTVHSALRAELVDLLTAGMLDMSALWSYHEGSDLPAELGIEVLGHEPTVLLVPSGFADHEPRLADLAGRNWLVRTADHPATTVLHQACATAGFEPHVVYEAHDYSEMQAMVAAGLGIAMVPRLAMQHHRRDVTMLGVDARDQLPVRSFLLATHVRRADSPPMAALRRTFRRVAQGVLD